MPFLEENMKKEESDVDKLKARHISFYLYKVTGKLDSRLTKEEEKAAKARVEYEGVKTQYEDICESYERKKAEYNAYCYVERDYKKMFKEKSEIVASGETEAGKRIHELRREKESYQHQLKETDKARKVVSAAVFQAEKVIHILDSAEAWGIYDVLGGGVIADIGKYGNIRDARTEILELKSLIWSMKSELSDVVRDGYDIEVNGILKLGDWMNNFFAEMVVLDRIQGSKRDVMRVKSDIEKVQQLLLNRRQKMENRIVEIDNEIEQLVVGQECL